MLRNVLKLAAIASLPLVAACSGSAPAEEPEPTSVETDMSQYANFVKDETLGITCAVVGNGKYAWGGCFSSEDTNVPAENTRVHDFVRDGTVMVDTTMNLVCVQFLGGKFAYGGCVPLNSLSAEAQSAL